MSENLRNYHLLSIFALVYFCPRLCTDLQKAISQQYKPFGFLPLQNLTEKEMHRDYTPKSVLVDTDFDPIMLHRNIFESGKYNYQGERIQLPTVINLKKFEELLDDYWDVQLLCFLKFGFPLSFPRECRSKLGKNSGNHASATQFP